MKELTHERDHSRGWRDALAHTVNPDDYIVNPAYRAGADATDGKRILKNPRRGFACRNPQLDAAGLMLALDILSGKNHG